MTLKVKFWLFLTPPHYTNSQNSIILFWVNLSNILPPAWKLENPYYHNAPAPFLLPFGRELLCTLLLLRTYYNLLTCYYIIKTVVDFSFFNTLFLKTFFFFLSFLCLFFLLHMQWSNSHPSWKSYPSVKEVGSSHCVKLYMNRGIGLSKKGHLFD